MRAFLVATLIAIGNAGPATADQPLIPGDRKGTVWEARCPASKGLSAEETDVLDQICEGIVSLNDAYLATLGAQRTVGNWAVLSVGDGRPAIVTKSRSGDSIELFLVCLADGGTGAMFSSSNLGRTGSEVDAVIQGDEAPPISTILMWSSERTAIEQNPPGTTPRIVRQLENAAEVAITIPTRRGQPVQATLETMGFDDAIAALGDCGR